MAKIVWRDASITVDGTDLSSHANDVTVEDTAAEVDFTGFGSSGYSEFGQGLKDATVTVTFYQDFDASSVHATLQPLYENGGTCTVVLKPTSATVSGTNPSATMVGRLYSYGFGGAVGDALTVEASFRNAGTAGITWATASS